MSMLGNMLIVGYGFPLAITACLLKGLSTNIPIFQSIACIHLNLAIITGTYMVFKKHPLTTIKSICILMPFITVDTFAYFIGIDMSTVGDVATMSTMIPITAAIVAYVFLKKRFDMMKTTIAILFCISGVILITQPEFLFSNTTKTWKATCGTFLGLISAIAVGCEINILSHFQIDTVSLLLIDSFCAFINYSIATLMTEHRIILLDNRSLLTILLATVMTFLVKWMAFIGYKLADPTTASILTLMQSPIAYLVQFMLLGKTANMTTLIGAGILVATIAWYVKSKNANNKDNEFLKYEEL